MTENLKTNEFNIDQNTLDISKSTKNKTNIELKNTKKDIGGTMDFSTFDSFPLKRKKDIGGSGFDGMPLKRNSSISDDKNNK